MRRLAALALVSAFVLAPAASVAALSGGTAAVAADGGATTGGSATPFAVHLPAGASCAGDSAHRDYRVQSYMVPASVDPATLTFGSVGPQPHAYGTNLRLPLYGPTNSGYVNAQTANADHASDPGAIVNVPAFSFGVFRPGDVPAGTYNIGIACTKGPASLTQLTAFWNAQIVLAASAIDTPAGLTWAAPGAAAPAKTPGAGTPGAAHDTAAVSAADTSAASTATASESGSAAHATDAAKPTGAPPSMGFPVVSLVHGGAVPAVGITVVLVLAVLFAAALRIGAQATRNRSLTPVEAG